MAWSLTIGCLLAVLLRLICKDSLPVLAPLFYATPLALIWSGWTVTGAIFVGLRKPVLAALAGILAVTCWVWWQQTAVVAAPQTLSVNSLRIVFWNAARLKSGWSPVAGQIAEWSSPLMGFVEAGSDGPEDRARWQQEYPHHRPIFFGNDMVLLTQAKLLETSSGQLARGCYYGLARLEWHEQQFTAILVDIHSSPFYSREPALTALADLANSITTEPVVIMGDFNTPADSVCFHDLRAGFQNAFESAGRGHSATWPTPCPVLAIDHVWTNRRFAVNLCRHARSAQSDHFGVIAELSFSK